MVIETNITKMFGVKTPILNAPMGPFLTNEISIAVCEAGGLGVVSHTAGLEATYSSYLNVDMYYRKLINSRVGI